MGKSRLSLSRALESRFMVRRDHFKGTRLVRFGASTARDYRSRMSAPEKADENGYAPFPLLSELFRTNWKTDPQVDLGELG